MDRLTRFEGRLQRLEADGDMVETAKHAVLELVGRIEEIERDRDAITAELMRTRETWRRSRWGSESAWRSLPPAS